MPLLTVRSLMAVHCGVCGERLYDATENYSGFDVAEDFKGWCIGARRKTMTIDDTCIHCWRILRQAVADAANVIVAANINRVNALRAELMADMERQAKLAKDRADFESEWAARRASGSK